MSPCTCKRGPQRDNCPACEGTGQRIDFAAHRAARTAAPHEIDTAFRDLEAALGWRASGPYGRLPADKWLAEVLREADRQGAENDNVRSKAAMLRALTGGAS